jgi:hypothetical protein
MGPCAGVCAALFWLRRRPDALVVPKGLGPHARFLGLLPLSARRLPSPRRAALWHPRRARVHARQTNRHVGQLLARPLDPRPAQHLPVCIEQPLRGGDCQAPQWRHLDLLPHPTGVASGFVQRLDRTQILHRPLARPGARRVRAPRVGTDAAVASRRVGFGRHRTPVESTTRPQPSTLAWRCWPSNCWSWNTPSFPTACM